MPIRIRNSFRGRFHLTRGARINMKIVFLFPSAPLPNLTSDDIDRALAPASSQSYSAPSPSPFESRQSGASSAPSVVPKGSDYAQSRYDTLDRPSHSWSSPSPTPSKYAVYQILKKKNDMRSKCVFFREKKNGINFNPESLSLRV